MLGSPKTLDALEVLEIEDLSKSFGQQRAVDGLSLSLVPQQILSLIGPSGCGKTTTLRLIAGLDRPDSGRVFLAGRDVTDERPERRGVGFVFQDYALFPHLTVSQNIAFGLDGRSREERTDRVSEVLRMVGMPWAGDRSPSQLSGGQQQRVALARALAPRPSLLLLDEPFSNLDPELRRKVRHELLDIIRGSGIAAVWVTHDHDEGLIVADKVVVMNEGRSRQVGTPSEIWRRPADAWVAGFIGHGDLIVGTVSGGLAVTPLGSVSAPDVPDGSEVKVLVRPDDVAIGQTGSQGTVVRRHFSGSDNIYCVLLDEGGLLHVKQPSDVEISRGSRITIALASSDLTVYS